MICVVYWLYDDTCINPATHGYVGITKSLPRRVAEHRRRFGDSFEVRVLLSGTWDECVAEEIRLRPEAGIGWNLVSGGTGGRSYPTSSKIRIGHANKGKKRSEAFKENIRRKMTGRKHDEQHVAKSAAALVGRPISDKTRAAFNIGRKKSHSPEARAKAVRNIVYTDELRSKLSAASKGRQRTPEHRAAIAEANRRRVVSEETRAKMRRAAEARSAKRKRVDQ